MPTDPLTGSRYPASTAAPNIPQDIQNAVLDLAGSTKPRFASTAARDAAYSAYVAAGGKLVNGMECWTDDVADSWDRVGGTWLQRGKPSTIRLTSTADASPTSTGHAFQIGPDNGLNLIIDQNEIIARNNGAASGVLFMGSNRLGAVADPTTGTDAATKQYVDGVTGTLPLIGGWGVLSGYHTPAYNISQGWVTLSGAVARTAASFALGSGTPFQFATLPSALVPVSTVSPLTYAGLGPNPVSTYSVRLYCTGGSTTLSVVGMDSGSGTMSQTVGYINLDGVTWRI